MMYVVVQKYHRGVGSRSINSKSRQPTLYLQSLPSWRSHARLSRLSLAVWVNTAKGGGGVRMSLPKFLTRERVCFPMNTSIFVSRGQLLSCMAFIDYSTYLLERTGKIPLSPCFFDLQKACDPGDRDRSNGALCAAQDDNISPPKSTISSGRLCCMDNRECSKWLGVEHGPRQE